MKIKDGFVKRKIGDKYLVVSTLRADSSSMFIELNESSSDIWDFIAKGYDEEATANELVKKYGIEKEKALADTKSIVEQMRQAGVLE